MSVATGVPACGSPGGGEVAVEQALKLGGGVGGAVGRRFRRREGVGPQVVDDGPGFPATFSPLRDLKRGLSYASTIARWDLQGSISCRNGEFGGATVTVEF